MMISRATQITVTPEGGALYDERATEVSIDDEAGGEFVVVRQHFPSNAEGEIRLDPSEWPEIRSAIDKMVEECRA